MKPIPLLACIALMMAAATPVAQAAGADVARQQRMDSAYQNWQQRESAPAAARAGKKAGAKAKAAKHARRP